MSKTYVVGHVNPDTDSIAAAMGYAWLLRERDGAEVIAARAGPLNTQTAWVLNTLGLEPPELLTDASPRFASVARRLDSLTPDRPLREAWAIANRTGFVAPVVNADGTPYGLISGMSLFAFLREMVGPHLDREEKEIPLGELFDRPCGQAADRGVPKFLATSRIRDALPRILREERNEFWVVDKEGRYFGVCRQRRLLKPPRLKLILVDHNEVGQAVSSLDEADLIEVLDHHRLGNPPTHLPIRFSVDVVGSTSTLVSERMEGAGLSAPPALAGLMLAGLLSDTLLLTSPTTTARDRQAAERMARWAFVGGSPLEGMTVESFGQQVLKAGTGLAARDPQAVVNGDLKIYSAGEVRFGVSQVEVTDLLELRDHLDALAQALEHLRDQRGLRFAMLMITDIVDGASRLLLRGEAPFIDSLPYAQLDDGTYLAEGVVSRKKQLLPVLLALLEG
jgi:manganese-dependent inorganic pyrophosphatase